MPIYDLTIAISPHMVVFPGDPSFESKKIMDVEKGDAFTLCHFGLGNHAGTHIDFPAHVTKGGKCSSDYPLEHLMGQGVIIEIEEDTHITAAHVDKADIKPGDIVFFKTKNTRNAYHERGVYTEDFAAVEPEAARLLVERGAKIVGIDYLSVDPVEDETLPAHRELLSNDVLIIENLKLNDVPAGRYQINIAPLKVEKADGLPVRVSACTTTVFADKSRGAYYEARQEYEKNRTQGAATQFKLG